MVIGLSGIKAQLASSRKEVAQAASSVAMVRLDQRLKEAAVFMSENHRLKKSNSFGNTYLDRSAFDSGKSYGENIHLGASLSAAKGTRLLGE